MHYKIISCAIPVAAYLIFRIEPFPAPVGFILASLFLFFATTACGLVFYIYARRGQWHKTYAILISGLGFCIFAHLSLGFIKDYRYLISPHQVTLNDIHKGSTIGYRGATYYHIIGQDPHGKDHKFSIRKADIKKLKNGQDVYIEFLPNTQTIIKINALQTEE